MIYLDNNATTPVLPEVLDAMLPYLADEFGNPSSTHQKGRKASEALELARMAVAELLGTPRPDEIVFTSGGTESDNWAILSALEVSPDRRHIVTTSVEHEAVRKLCQRLETQGFEVSWIGVDGDGRLDLDELKDSLRPDTAIVSAMMANNETGAIFPTAQIAEIVKSRSDALFHVDGINAAGKIDIDVVGANIDLFSISAHKLHGPKGIGALYVRSGVKLSPRLTGGGQEHAMRPGTEPVHQIVGMGAAARLVKDTSVMAEVEKLRNRLENSILANLSEATVNGSREPTERLSNTTNISFEGINGEMILDRLDRYGIFVSTGSACHSEDHAPSPVLQAMQIPYSRAIGSIRFSLGRTNTEDDIDTVIEVVPRVIAELKELSGSNFLDAVPS